MTTIGKYEILEEVGRGGFSIVYKARDPGLDRPVALKVLLPHRSWNPTFAERFRNEAQATAKLRHPNIVYIHKVGEDDEQLYIAMEFLPGRTLAQLLQDEGAMPLQQALDILEQIASALDYAHAEGVLHRDVKPSNIMVHHTNQGQLRAVLTDFGLVKLMGSDESITSTGTILGSPAYMAPEQAEYERRDEIGPATDYYALGIVAYEMLTGRVPFPGNTPSTLVAHVLKPPPDPLSIRHDLPPAVAQVLLKALSKKGQDRYPSAGEMVHALRENAQAEQEARQREETAYETSAPSAVSVAAVKPESTLEKERGKELLKPDAPSAKQQPSPAQEKPRPRRALPGRAWILGGLAVVALVIGLVIVLRAMSSRSPETEPTHAPLPTEAPRAVESTKTPAPTVEALPVVKAGMVSDIGGIHDASFNQNTWEGLQRAREELGVQTQFIESQSQADYEKNITEFAELGYDLIITVGYLLGDATAKMAEQYPDIKMAIIDFAYDPPIPNVAGIVFNVDEAAFPAGYLAAGWADLKDPGDPQVGWIGGMQIPPVEQFIVAYEAGVDYYNQQKGKSVQIKGVYVGDFDAPDQGKIHGQSLIDEGVDVIFGVGGKTGNGSLIAAKENGKWGIGVDVDQYYTLPNEKDILITSCMKRLDKAVFGVVESVTKDEFPGGSVYVGTLENNGVGLAPYHDFENEIPDELKAEVDAVLEGIKNGKIDTGW